MWFVHYHEPFKGEMGAFCVEILAALSACGGEKLTLVVDEAVGGEQFEGVDFEEDSVEQEVVSCGTELGVVAQTRLRELLQRAKKQWVQHAATAPYGQES